MMMPPPDVVGNPQSIPTSKPIPFMMGTPDVVGQPLTNPQQNEPSNETLDGSNSENKRENNDSAETTSTQTNSKDGIAKEDESNQAVPVAAVDLSEWVEFPAPNGLFYYHNYTTKESTYRRPLDFGRKPFKIRAVIAYKTGIDEWRRIRNNLGFEYYYNINTKEATWLTPQQILDLEARKASVIEEEEDNEDEIVVGSSKVKRKLSESSKDEDDEKKQKTEDNAKPDELPFEERVEIFKQMLREKNVAAFSTWEKELPKFAFDSRFQILPIHSDRRAVFNSYVKNKMEEERIQKKERLSAAKDAVQKILKAENTTLQPSLSFDDFKKRFGDDEAVKALSAKEKEKFYQDLITPIKKLAEEKEAREKEKATTVFNEILKINSKRIQESPSWTKTREDIIEKDLRHAQVQALNSKEQEELFRKFADRLQEQEKKKQREEASKRERERQVEKMRGAENRERDRVLGIRLKEEEETHYITLLKERIRDPEASWSRSREVLEADSRYHTRHLRTEDKERLFRDHLRHLLEDQIKNYKNLLREHTEKGNITLATKDFEDIRDHIKDDPRYEKLYSDDRRFIFRAFLKDLKTESFVAFQNMLREYKNSGVITIRSATSGPRFEDLKDILKNDRRYTTLEAFDNEREEELIKFIMSLGGSTK